MCLSIGLVLVVLLVVNVVDPAEHEDGDKDRRDAIISGEFSLPRSGHVFRAKSRTTRRL